MLPAITQPVPLFLADVDDWVQIVILILVVGGSALGSVSKKLIEHFGSKESPSPESEDFPGRIPGPARPDHPPARPMPARGSQPPPAHPAPLRPLVLERVPDKRVTPPLVAPTDTPVARPAPKTLHPASPTDEPAQSRRGVPPAPAKRRPARRASRSAETVAATASHGFEPTDHLPHLDPEEHLGHLAPEGHLGNLDVTEQTVVETKDELLDQVRRPSRAALRRAIVMSEILAPPLALRD